MFLPFVLQTLSDSFSLTFLIFIEAAAVTALFDSNSGAIIFFFIPLFSFFIVISLAHLSLFFYLYPIIFYLSLVIVYNK